MKKRDGLYAVPLVIGLALVALFGAPRTTAGTVWTYDFLGTPATPQAVNSLTNPDWDIHIHKRGQGQVMDPTTVEHGTDCATPPATHLITQLADGVFLCNNHVMTAITDHGYGQIVLTPDRLVDFSAGEAVVSFNVSPRFPFGRQWLTFDLTPFIQNLTVYNNEGFDPEGLPWDVVQIRQRGGGANGGTHFTVSINRNGTTGTETSQNSQSVESLIPNPAPGLRIGFEVHLSTTHVKFCAPSLAGIHGFPGCWVDQDIFPALTWNQSIFAIVHHSYDPCKGIGGTCPYGLTWHWSTIAISSAVAFTMIHGDQAFLNNATSPIVNFTAPSPTSAYLRFSGRSGTQIQYSLDAGVSWQTAAYQQSTCTVSPPCSAFRSYWQAIPVGTSSVQLRGTNNYTGSWWVRNPSMWSLN